MLPSEKDVSMWLVGNGYTDYICPVSTNFKDYNEGGRLP